MTRKGDFLSQVVAAGGGGGGVALRGSLLDAQNQLTGLPILVEIPAAVFSGGPVLVIAEVVYSAFNLDPGPDVSIGCQISVDGSAIGAEVGASAVAVAGEDFTLMHSATVPVAAGSHTVGISIQGLGPNDTADTAVNLTVIEFTL